jgi:hypothetical protein
MTGLLLIQSTVCVILLAGAGLFGASLYRLWAQDFGMRMDEVLIVDFELGPERIDGQDEILQRALLTVRPLPGVEMATTIDAIPFSGFNVPPIAVPGRAEPPAVGQQLPYLTAATPEFLSILGIQLVEGRMLSDDDDRGTPVVMVNQSMARGVWPGESAVGKCIWLRSGLRSVRVVRSADPVRQGAVPGSGGRRARRASAVGPAIRQRRSADAVLRAALTGAVSALRGQSAANPRSHPARGRRCAGDDAGGSPRGGG